MRLTLTTALGFAAALALPVLVAGQTKDDFEYWDANGNGDLTCSEARSRDEGLRLPAHRDKTNDTAVIYEWISRVRGDSDNHLPRELHNQARSVPRTAWKLDTKAGKARIEQFAFWVEMQDPDAARSLREGLNKLFTVSAIGLAPAFKRCLGTTNVIDNAHSGILRRTGRVTRWKNGSMAVRWAAAAFMEAEKGYPRIMGYSDLWMLMAHLDELSTPPVEQEEDAA